MVKKYILPLFLLLFFSCQNEETIPPLFRAVPPAECGIQFTNTIQNTEDLNIFTYRNFYNGGGVGIGDFNNDGLPDLYLTANMSANQLYLNKGNFEFENITESAGVALPDMWSTGVTVVDINADGWLDIYVCNAGYEKGKLPENKLFINQKNLTFVEQAADYGLNDAGYSTHASFFDYDKDGDLDMYLVNNSFIPTNTLNYSNKRDLKYSDWDVADFLKGGGDKFFRNDNGKYVDASEVTGIYQSLIGFGLGVSVADVNGDMYEDIYISNDFFERDYLYINQKDGTFSEELETHFDHISHSSMGADIRDVNRDGQVDIFVTDMLPYDEYRVKTTASFDDINLRKLKVNKGFYHQYMHNTLQINQGNRFAEIAQFSGVAATDWSWGALIFDADNDGWNDLLVCNGIYHDVIDLDFMDFFANEVLQKMALTGNKQEMNEVIGEMPSVPISNKIFRNSKGNQFEDVTTAWGLDQKTFSNGAAYADFDNDGDLDLIINNVNQPLGIFRNESGTKGTLIKLKGSKKNPDAIGAKVVIWSKNQQFTQQMQPARGFQSSIDQRLHFGINSSEIDSIQVFWNPNEKSVIRTKSDTPIIEINYEKIVAFNPKKNTTELIFQTKKLENTAQKEDDHIDFYEERGAYRMLSKEGPTLAIGDVNGDGLEDIFIGGARFEPAKILLQKPDKTFQKIQQPALEKHLKFEDTASALADVDGDGDLDLIVGSGGNFEKPNSPFLTDRIYRNNGQGTFEYYSGITNKTTMNTSKIIAWDFDEDGDTDLFVFSRSVPQNYGFKPPHFLYENDGTGIFKEVSVQLANGFKGIGMVTDAILSTDNQSIIVTGEWVSPIRIFTQNGKIIWEENCLTNEAGWYNHIATADLNDDGKPDYLLGNHGENAYLKLAEDEAYTLWINDFDDNKAIDKILCKSKGGKDFPVALKKDLADQIVAIKKKGIQHKDYATKSMRDLFTKAKLNSAGRREATELRSAIYLSQPDGGYVRADTPVQLQWSSVHASAFADVDSDGDLDVIFGGNDYDWRPQFSRLDAFKTEVLRNDGEGKFSYLTPDKTGLNIAGQMRDLKAIEVGDETWFVVGVNGDALHFIK